MHKVRVRQDWVGQGMYREQESSHLVGPDPTTNFDEGFYHEWMLNLSNAFSASIEMIM